MMKCDCFNCKPSFSVSSSFSDKLKESKCTCLSRFCVKENRSSFYLESTEIEKVDKIKVDGYLDSSSTHKKCDYLFVYDKKCFIFIELKGEDIDIAVEQIDSTITLFFKNKVLEKCKVVGIIINSRNPSNCASYRLAKKKLEKKIGKYFAGFQLMKEFMAGIYNPQEGKLRRR